MTKDLPLNDVLDELERRYGTDKKPIGAHVNIRWMYDGEELDGYYISFGEYNEADCDSFGVPDNSIFFYCDGEHALKSYMTKGVEDFVVLNYELKYKD